MSEREIAYDILKKVIIDDKYANLLMRNYESAYFGFITTIVYGVLRNYTYLCYQYNKLIDKKPKTEVEILLSMAIYEYYYMKQSDYVIVNEYVNLAGRHYKGFINATLRNVIKQGFIESNQIDVIYSCPKWICSLIRSHYGDDIAYKILDNSTKQLPIYYRLNTLKASYNDFEDINILDNSFFTSTNNLLKSKEFKDGKFIIQDYGTLNIIKALDIKPDLNVLDMCSAPGGNTTHISSIMNNTGSIIATDLYQHRITLLENNIKLLNTTTISTLVYDHLIYNENWSNKFDRIVLDAPCSGLGVLSRKPEIKFKLKPEDIDNLVITQNKLIRNAIKYLKLNGILVYSTCTLNYKENTKIIKELLKEYDNIKLVKEETIYSFINNTDSFYYAKIIKVKI